MYLVSFPCIKYEAVPDFIMPDRFERLKALQDFKRVKTNYIYKYMCHSVLTRPDNLPDALQVMKGCEVDDG